MYDINYNRIVNVCCQMNFSKQDNLQEWVYHATRYSTKYCLVLFIDNYSKEILPEHKGTILIQVFNK